MAEAAPLLDGLARHLAGLGLVTYDPDGTCGDLFLETMPQVPDEAVVLTLYDGEQPDPRLPYDTPRLQGRVRGGADPRVSRARCAALYDELHGLGAVTLPGGVLLLSCDALQSGPVSMGLDDSGRHEHVTNYAIEFYAPTTHRQ